MRATNGWGWRSTFDFSNYPTNQPNYDKSSAKQLGLCNAESDGPVITNFVAQMPTKYAMLIEQERGNQENMTAKGCPQASKKKQVELKSYIETLQEYTTTQNSFKCIRQNHQIYALGINEKGLSPFANKSYYVGNIHFSASAHTIINSEV